MDNNNILSNYFDRARKEEIDVSVDDVRGILHGRHIGTNWQFAKKGNSYQNLKYFIMGTGALILAGIIYFFMPEDDLNSAAIFANNSGKYSITIENVVDENGSQTHMVAGNNHSRKQNNEFFANTMENEAQAMNPADSTSFADTAQLNDLQSAGVPPAVDFKEAPDKNKPLTFNEDDYSVIRRFKAGVNPKLTVKISAGNITVHGYDGNEIVLLVNVFKSGRRHSKITDKAILEKAIETIFTNGTAEVSFSIDGNVFNKNTYAEIEVHTPYATIGNLKTDGGNIMLTDLSSNQDVHTSGGNIVAENISAGLKARTDGGDLNIKSTKGNIQLNTSGGNINVHNSLGDVNAQTSGGNIFVDDVSGNVHVNTSGGNIQFQRINGSLLSANTSGGSISLDKVNADDISVKTSGGNIHATGSIGALKAKTSGGNINFSTTKLSGAVDLRTSGGNVSATVPNNIGLSISLKGDNVRFDKNGFEGTSKEGNATGTINGGGIPITVKANGGNAYLIRE